MQVSDIYDFQACTEYKLMLSSKSMPFPFLVCSHLTNFKVFLNKERTDFSAQLPETELLDAGTTGVSQCVSSH